MRNTPLATGHYLLLIFYFDLKQNISSSSLLNSRTSSIEATCCFVYSNLRIKDNVSILEHFPQRIMEWLPLRDAAGMSVLSHRWQEIWTSIPHLVFDIPFFISLKEQVHGSDGTQKYCNIVNKILLQHEGPILKFSMQIPPQTPIPDVASWTSYLSRNGLREFSLLSCDENIRPSSRLFSCGGLEKLKLSYCRFSLPPNFMGFAKMTSLELERVYLSQSILKKLTTNCSVLKKLVLTYCRGMEQMHIVIDAPNLQILILDWAFKSLELKSCEKLVSASIGIIFANKCHKDSVCNLVKVLATSSKLESLCLRGWFCGILFKEHSFQTTFERLRNLEFPSLRFDSPNDLSSLLSCMQSFTSIETLRISVYTSFNKVEHVLDFNPDYKLHHLRFATVGIPCGVGPELKLVEFLLACSPVLEKLTVSYTAQLCQSSHSNMLIQLNRFRRASQKVQVVCPQPEIPARRGGVKPARRGGVQPARRGGVQPARHEGVRLAAGHAVVQPAVSSSEDGSSNFSSSGSSYSDSSS